MTNSVEVEAGPTTADVDPVKKVYHEIPRGLPKSGRPWKTVREKRYGKSICFKKF